MNNIVKLHHINNEAYLALSVVEELDAHINASEEVLVESLGNLLEDLSEYAMSDDMVDVLIKRSNADLLDKLEHILNRVIKLSSKDVIEQYEDDEEGLFMMVKLAQGELNNASAYARAILMK